MVAHVLISEWMQGKIDGNAEIICSSVIGRVVVGGPWRARFSDLSFGSAASAD
jgi:hypothetical protein